MMYINLEGLTIHQILHRVAFQILFLCILYMVLEYTLPFLTYDQAIPTSLW